MNSPTGASVRTLREENGHGILYDRGQRIDLGSRSAEIDDGFVNADRWIGTEQYLETGGGAYHAAVWRQGEMIEIPPPDGFEDTNIRGLNDRGQVLILASHRTTTEDRSKALLWENGSLTPLPTLGGDQTEPYALGETGQAVGVASYRGEKVPGNAVLWDHSRIYDLNRLIAPASGWKLHEAFGINSHGWIVGEGRYKNQEQAFLLIPLPSPGDRGKPS
jgi:uncharacterized membrane protein